MEMGIAKNSRRARSYTCCFGRAMLILLLLLQQNLVVVVVATPQLGTSLVEANNSSNRGGGGEAVGGGGRMGHGNSTVGAPALFSKEWEEQYSSGNVGCTLGRKRYYWRQCGIGSNIVQLMNALVYGITVMGWSDVAVVTSPGMLGALHCTAENGNKIHGYFCLFRPMPHVCTFHSQKEWKDFMRTKGVPASEIEEGAKLDWQFLRLTQRALLARALADHGVDTLGASAVMARYFWNNLTPWLEEDIEKALDRPQVDVFRREPYVGLHIRRGDKVAEGEAKKVDTKEYLSAAAEYLEGQEVNGSKDIRAIWVASTDSVVIQEVRSLAQEYFPNVPDTGIVWGSKSDDGKAIATHSKSMDYSDTVMVFADLQMLSASPVFVGTFSSNIGRVVALLREGIHGHPRDSCISLDKQDYGTQYL